MLCHLSLALDSSNEHKTHQKVENRAKLAQSLRLQNVRYLKNLGTSVSGNLVRDHARFVKTEWVLGEGSAHVALNSSGQVSEPRGLSRTRTLSAAVHCAVQT